MSKITEGDKLIAKFMDIEYNETRSHWNTSWDYLMPVCKKITETYFDKREHIFRGLLTCDHRATYEAVVAFLQFWFDDNQFKHTWADSEIHKQQLKWVNQNNN